MKKVLLWTAGGIGMATVCGLAGLSHLSATLVTLTLFCAGTAFLGFLCSWFLGFTWSLPDRIAAWVERLGSNTVIGKRERAE
ncbi:hypothetical protein ACC704_07670 [Rhizobium johnstonii]|uniref:hypothetical protein n=1 Tax=Rhizobium johnstonii TaxID=3019933 RepID=UPI003F9D0697